MNVKFLSSTLAACAIAMAFSATSSIARANDFEFDEAAASVEALIESDDIYADPSQSSAQLLDAQLRPGGPRGPGHGGPGGPGHGGPGHGPGWGDDRDGRGPRRWVTCYSYNRRGQVFRGVGRDLRSAMYDAESNCYRSSRRCSTSPRDCR